MNMSLKRENSKKILVSIPTNILKELELIRSKYRSRSEIIREALELLILSHKRKQIEREFREGFRMLNNLNREFAEKSLMFGSEKYKN
jgi:metal-responsive CopG/Arc/MetJ family transcriptional regulator